MTQLFSSLPSYVDVACMSSDVESVKQVFLERPGVWLTGAEVEELLGWRKQKTAEKVRRIVSELLELGFPVVHGHQGFMLTVDRVELLRAADDLSHRISGIARKRDRYLRIAQVREAGQLSLVVFA